jgi:hypothetical protein
MGLRRLRAREGEVVLALLFRIAARFMAWVDDADRPSGSDEGESEGHDLLSFGVLLLSRSN